MYERTVRFENSSWEIEIRDEADESVVAEIFKWREYRIAEKFLQGARYPLLDVGAHAGFFTLYARALNATVPIVALEPEANNFKQLQKHLRKNKVVGVAPLPLALSDATGMGALGLSADSHNHALVDKPAVKGDDTVMRVPTIAFADLLAQEHIDRISVLKMDIEGGEYRVLRSLSPEDFARIGAIIMEYHDVHSQKHDELERLLREGGFGVQSFPSKFDKTMGFLWAVNKRSRV